MNMYIYIYMYVYKCKAIRSLLKQVASLQKK